MDEWNTLEEVDQLKYLGPTQTNKGRKIKLHGSSTLSHDRASNTMEKWRNNAISVPTKIQLYKSLVNTAP